MHLPGFMNALKNLKNSTNGSSAWFKRIVEESFQQYSTVLNLSRLYK